MEDLKRKYHHVDLSPLLFDSVTWQTDIEAAIEAAEAGLAGAGAPLSWDLTLIIFRLAQRAGPALGGGRGAGHPGTRPVIGQHSQYSAVIGG